MQRVIYLEAPNPRPAFLRALMVALTLGALLVLAGCADMDVWKCGEGHIYRDGHCIAHGWRVRA